MSSLTRIISNARKILLPTVYYTDSTTLQLSGSRRQDLPNYDFLHNQSEDMTAKYIKFEVHTNERVRVPHFVNMIFSGLQSYLRYFLQ